MLTSVMPNLPTRARMLSLLRQTMVVVGLALAAACSCDEADRSCQSTNDCRSNELCLEGTCRQVCNRDHDCRGSERCAGGICTAGKATADGAVLDAVATDSRAEDRMRLDGSVADRTAPVDALAGDLSLGSDVLVTEDGALAPDRITDRLTDRAVADALTEDRRSVDVSFGDLLPGDTVANPDAASPDASATDGTATADAFRADAAAPCQAPIKMYLECEDTVSAQIPATCRLITGSFNSDQAECFSCSTRIGYTPVEYTGFEDASGNCTHNGWQLISGDLCSNDVTGCNPSSTGEPCCDDFASIFDNRWGCALRSVKSANCGGNMEQWRLHKTFDLSGLHDLRFCYDVSESWANNTDAVIVQLNDSANFTQLSCVSGDTSWRGRLQTICSDLPAWADDNSGLTVTFIAHSNGNTHELRIDNIFLYGWHNSCTNWRRLPLFMEDFDSCTDPIADGWNGWEVTGAPSCGGSGCQSLGTSASANGDVVWSIGRDIDLTDISGGVELCFSAGDDSGGMEEFITLSADLNNGDELVPIGSGSPYGANDMQCEPFCFGFAGLDAQVAHQPQLGISLGLRASTDSRTLVDNISVSGVRSCPGNDHVSLGARTAESPGTYSFPVQSISHEPLTAEVICSWQGDSRVVTERIKFVP